MNPIGRVHGGFISQDGNDAVRIHALAERPHDGITVAVRKAFPYPAAVGEFLYSRQYKFDSFLFLLG